MTNHHHDVFQQSMRDMDLARDLLRHFLPEDIQLVLDWDSLALACNDLFPDQGTDLRTDVLYQIQLLNSDSHLIAHVACVSSHDPQMAVHTQQYQAKIIERYLVNHTYAPLVYSLFINRSTTPDTGPKNLSQLYAPEIQPLVEKYLGQTLVCDQSPS